MKKVVILSLIVLLVLPSILAAAVDVSFNKPTFDKGETIIAKISGNFLTQITKENILFYREGHIRVPFEFNINKIGDDFYVYALSESDQVSGNYSLSITGIQYMNGSSISDEEVLGDFSISEDIAYFSLNPGVISSSGEFSITVQNLKESAINVIVNTKASFTEREIFILPDSSKEKTFSLKTGEVKNIYFSAGAGDPSLRKITLSSENFSCEVPVYLAYVKGTREQLVKFDSSEIPSSIETNSEEVKIITLYNNADEDLTNISLSLDSSLSPYINLSVYHLDNLTAKSSVPIELSFYSEDETYVEGNLEARTEDGFSLSTLISFDFISNITNATLTVANKTNATTTVKTCSESGGVLCNTETHQCDGGKISNEKDGWCCISGTCNPKKKEDNSIGRIIAIVIIVLIIGGLVWFYKFKYKKSKKPVDLLKFAKGKSKEPSGIQFPPKK